MLEGRAEKFSLTMRRYTGNNNDHSRMQRFLSMESEQVGRQVQFRYISILCYGKH
jgi:hypothetical protein